MSASNSERLINRVANADLKIAQKLKLKKYRAELKLFVAEGLRLCEMVNPAQIEFGFFTAEFLKGERQIKLVEHLKNFAQMYEIPMATFEKISDTETPQGVMLIVRQKLSTLEELLTKKIIVALDAVRDAGNLGTILRTAEAFNCGVVVLEESVDIFNSKVVRASMGAIFNLSMVKLSRLEFLNTMNLAGIEILAAALDSSAEIYFNHKFTAKSALVFGNEAEGVSAEILSTAKKIYIPMSGRAESLNVAQAAAIIISEATRQKFFLDRN